MADKNTAGGNKNKGQNFLTGAAIYTVGIVVVKILGAIYKIPLGNILDDYGFNLFDVTYKIYNVFLTIATAGLPVAMSRLISEANSLGREQQVKRTFTVSTLTFMVLGAIGTILMLLFPGGMADWMGQPGAKTCIFIMAPSVVLVCVAAAYRGYAQGHSDMIPTTISQIIETAVKVLVGLACAGVLHAMGKSVELCAAGAILGTTVSSLAATAYMHFCVRRKYEVNPAVTEESDKPDSRRKILWDLLRIGIPITISTSIMSLVQLADAKITLNQLQNALNLTAEAAGTLNGAYSKAMTIYNVPSAFVAPFVAAVVPAIAAARVRGNREEVCGIAESSMRMCTLLCLPMGVGMAVLAGPIMNVLYPGSDAHGIVLLAELGAACYFMAMSLMTNAILPANGNERLPLISILCGAVAKVVVTYVLVGMPSVGIYGAPIGTISCYIVMVSSNLIFMRRKMARPISILRVLGKPFLSSAVMGVVAWGSYKLLGSALSGAASRVINLYLPFIVAVGLAVVVYLVMIIVTRSITKEDLLLMPKGEKIAKLLHIR